MTVNINDLKERSRNGKVAFGSIITDLLDRSLETPDDAIVDVSIDKNNNLVLKKDNGNYETVEISTTTYDDKINIDNILSSHIDLYNNGDKNILQFYKMNGEKDVQLEIPTTSAQSGINKSLVLSYVKQTGEDEESFIYTVYNYNDVECGTMKVYKNPKITHITGDKILSTIEKDTTNTSKNEKFNINDYNNKTVQTITSNYMPQGDAGNYKTIKDVLGDDVKISELTAKKFNTKNIYIPEVFEYGDEKNKKEYLGYYVPNNDDSFSTNLLLQIQSSEDKSIEIFDILSSFNASEVTALKLSNLIMVNNKIDKPETHTFAIRPNEINVSGGGFLNFDFILNNESDDQNINGQTFVLGKVDYGDYTKDMVDDKSFNLFNLFDLSYEPYSTRNLSYDNTIFGSKVVPGYNSDGIMEPYLISIYFKYVKDVIDPKKDKINLSIESYGLFLNKNGFDTFKVKEKGILIPMSRSIS